MNWEKVKPEEWRMYHWLRFELFNSRLGDGKVYNSIAEVRAGKEEGQHILELILVNHEWR